MLINCIEFVTITKCTNQTTRKRTNYRPTPNARTKTQQNAQTNTQPNAPINPQPHAQTITLSKCMKKTPTKSTNQPNHNHRRMRAFGDFATGNTCQYAHHISELAIVGESGG